MAMSARKHLSGWTIPNKRYLTLSKTSSRDGCVPLSRFSRNCYIFIGKLLICRLAIFAKGHSEDKVCPKNKQCASFHPTELLSIGQLLILSFNFLCKMTQRRDDLPPKQAMQISIQLDYYSKKRVTMSDREEARQRVTAIAIG